MKGAGVGRSEGAGGAEEDRGVAKGSSGEHADVDEELGGQEDHEGRVQEAVPGDQNRLGATDFGVGDKRGGRSGRATEDGRDECDTGYEKGGAERGAKVNDSGADEKEVVGKVE